jgi:DNA repair protein RadD
MIELWDFQEILGTSARKALRKVLSVLVVLPTGGGKSIITAWMVKNAIAKGNTAYFCVHRKDLVTQMSGTFREFEIPFGYIAAGRKYNPFQPVQICSIQTLRNRLDKVPAPNILIVDEAHFSCSKTYSEIIDLYESKGTFIIGKTATPWRLSGEGLARHFKEMVVGPSVRELMDRGFLSKYKFYAPSKPDLSKTHSRMGDFVKEEIEEVMDRKTITGDAVKHYQKYAMNKKAVAFCVSIKHSQHVAESFRAAGIMALHVDGKTPHADRMKAFNAFADGEIKVLTSVAIFSEGLDLAALVGREVCIEAAILLRPTQSLSLFLQQVGRALRRKLEPAIILDHAGNYLRHGLPDDDREWTLSGRKKGKKKEEEAAVQVRQCPECYAVHKPAPICPECQYKYPIQSREVEENDGDLEELNVEEIRRQKRKEQGGANSIEQLIALGKARGYKNPASWARHVFNGRKAKQMAG